MSTQTALHRAAQEGHVNILSLLVAAGAGPSAFALRGSSAFATTAADDQVEAVYLLLPITTDPIAKQILDVRLWDGLYTVVEYEW